jgi:UDPglucose 6-dehydrogenase
VSALVIFKTIVLTDMASLPKKCFGFKRSAMYQNPSSNVDPEDSVLDISTAPTTPDGSLTFSPVLQALKLQDALEDASSKEGERKGSASLDATLYFSPSEIKNVCCVGAGYVGPSHSDPLPIFNTYLFVYQVVQQQP